MKHAFILVLSALLIALVTSGCDETDCEDRCGDGEWYEECEECAEGPPLRESECADIWCD